MPKNFENQIKAFLWANTDGQTEVFNSYNELIEKGSWDDLEAGSDEDEDIFEVGLLLPTQDDVLINPLNTHVFIAIQHSDDNRIEYLEADNNGYTAEEIITNTGSEDSVICIGKYYALSFMIDKINSRNLEKAKKISAQKQLQLLNRAFAQFECVFKPLLDSNTINTDGGSNSKKEPMRVIPVKVNFVHETPTDSSSISASLQAIIDENIDLISTQYPDKFEEAINILGDVNMTENPTMEDITALQKQLTETLGKPINLFQPTKQSPKKSKPKK